MDANEGHETNQMHEGVSDQSTPGLGRMEDRHPSVGVESPSTPQDVNVPTPPASDLQPAVTIHTRFARFDAYLNLHTERTVVTTFPDGFTCEGSRSVTPDNVREAHTQGYSGSDPYVVWRSLVDHELLHTVLYDELFNRPSAVLRTESGAEFTPSWVRYQEEALVLSMQHYLHTDVVTDTLNRYMTRYVRERFGHQWWSIYNPQLVRLWEGV